METLLLYIADVRSFINKERFNRYYSCMPGLIQEKIANQKQDKARRQTLGAWSLLCGALCDEMGACSLEEFAGLDIVYGKYGKPFINNMSEVHFNLAHSEDYAVCALSDSEVGCDIEKISEIKKGVAERFFTPEEQACIKSVDDFFKIWVKKECIIKCTGEGMARPLDSFSVLGNKVDVNGETLYVGMPKAPNGYKIAVCNNIERNKARFVNKTFN